MKRKRQSPESILRELCNDVEAVGIEQLRDDPLNASDHQWPDLLVTYQKAKHALGEKTESELIRSAYRKGQCPDCQEPIPEWVVDGENCFNCGHVFGVEKPNDGAKICK